MEGCDGAARFARPAVDEVCSSRQGFDPESAGHASMEQKGADAIIQSSNDPFSFAILGGGIWTGKAKSSAMSLKMRAQGMVIKLPSIVSLESE